MKIFYNSLLKKILIICFIIAPLVSHAQVPSLAWAKQAGGTVDDNGESIDIDANGNVYITGVFMNTVDFDPGPGVYNLTAMHVDSYVLKLDPAGNFLWVKQFTEVAGINSIVHSYSIKVNAAGEVFTTGFFNATVDFDPGPGTLLMAVPANLSVNIFVTKLDTDGNLVWAKQFDAWEANEIQLDATGNIYITGMYRGTVDFDPGPGVVLLSGFNDLFVLKLKPNGNLAWAKGMNGDFNANPNHSYSIALDVNNNVYITGRLFTTIDCDPGPGTYYLTPAGTHGGFVIKLDNLGNFVYAKQLGEGSVITEGLDILARPDGHVYVCGYFNGTGDFDPGPSTFNMNSPVHSDGFLVELDNTGNLVWAKQFAAAGGGIMWMYSMVFDASGNIFITGYFNGTPIDFDAGPGNYMVATPGGWDGFVAKYDNNGNFIWERSISDDVVAPAEPGSQICFDLVVGPTGSIYITGDFQAPYPATAQYPGTADFDPCEGKYDMTPVLGADIFVVKWDPFVAPASSVTISASTITTCVNANVTFTAIPVNEGPTPVYQWQLNGINTGTNDISYSNSALNNGDVVTVIMTPSINCASNTPVTSNTITITVSSPSTPSISISASATTACLGSTITFTASPVNGGTAPQYQWKKNGINTGTDNPVYTDNSWVDGDIISCELTSNAGCISTANAISNSITLHAVQPLVPSVNITASATTVCQGAPVSFTATPINGGSAPQYQWKKNGINTGTNNSTFTANNWADGDVINCVLTSNAGCITGPIATSNDITLHVVQTVIPSVTINALPATVCQGSPVSFTAVPVNGGTAPGFQWKKNGSDVGTNAPTYTDNTLMPGDLVSCILTSNAGCATAASATGSITIPVNPLPVVVITAAPSGYTTNLSPVVITATATPPANIFTWYHNNALIPSITGNTLTVEYGQAGEYNAFATDMNGCSNGSNRIIISDSIIQFVFISPNPNSGEFIIRWMNNESSTTRYITIWDSKGAKVYSGSFMVTSADGKINLHLEYLSSGVYFIQLSDKNKKLLKTGKVVIK